MNEKETKKKHNSNCQTPLSFQIRDISFKTWLEIVENYTNLLGVLPHTQNKKHLQYQSHVLNRICVCQSVTMTVNAIESFETIWKHIEVMNCCENVLFFFYWSLQFGEEVLGNSKKFQYGGEENEYDIGGKYTPRYHHTIIGYFYDNTKFI